jgi:hypothetical protein
MSLGRVLGICAVPVGLFAGAVGVVLLVSSHVAGGVVFAVLGGLLALAGSWMLVTGKPHSLPFTPAKPGGKRGTDWSAFPDLL